MSKICLVSTKSQGISVRLRRLTSVKSAGKVWCRQGPPRAETDRSRGCRWRGRWEGLRRCTVLPRCSSTAPVLRCGPAAVVGVFGLQSSGPVTTCSGTTGPRGRRPPGSPRWRWDSQLCIVGLKTTTWGERAPEKYRCCHLGQTEVVVWSSRGRPSVLRSHLYADREERRRSDRWNGTRPKTLTRQGDASDRRTFRRGRGRGVPEVRRGPW